MNALARYCTAALVGMLLALSLGLARLTRPEVIVGFVDVLGDWDPTVLFFMAGANASFALAYRAARRRGAPLLEPEFVWATNRSIDGRLLLGSSLFGAGWAIGGACPGPALTSLGGGATWALPFVAAMVLGLWLGAPGRFSAPRRTVSTSPG